MRDRLQIVGIVFLLLGFALFIGKFVPANPAALPDRGKGAYASVVTSGAFGNWGLALIGIGCVFFLARTFFRE
jgi:hypothetical protein